MKIENEYPKIDKDIWDLKLFETTIVSITQDISYQLMRVPNGWIWMDAVFIPFSEKHNIVNAFII